MEAKGNLGPGDIKPGLMRAASELMGGVSPLAERLGISEAMLRRYIAGSFAVPDALILRALDLMQEEREQLSIAPAIPSADGDFPRKV